MAPRWAPNLRPYSRVAGNFVARSQPPDLPESLINTRFSRYWAPGTRERATLYNHELIAENYGISERQNLTGGREPRRNDSLGRSATELAEGRFVMQAGKRQGGEREVSRNKVRTLNKK